MTTLIVRRKSYSDVGYNTQCLFKKSPPNILANTSVLSVRIRHTSFSWPASSNYNQTAYNQQWELWHIDFLSSLPTVDFHLFFSIWLTPRRVEKSTEDRRDGKEGQKHSYSTGAFKRWLHFWPWQIDSLLGTCVFCLFKEPKGDGTSHDADNSFCSSCTPLSFPVAFHVDCLYLSPLSSPLLGYPVGQDLKCFTFGLILHLYPDVPQ